MIGLVPWLPLPVLLAITRGPGSQIRDLSCFSVVAICFADSLFVQKQVCLFICPFEFQRGEQVLRFLSLFFYSLLPFYLLLQPAAIQTPRNNVGV